MVGSSRPQLDDSIPADLRPGETYYKIADAILAILTEPPFDVDQPEAWRDDLAAEIETAVTDRWVEWLLARKAGLPLGRFVEEAS